MLIYVNKGNLLTRMFWNSKNGTPSRKLRESKLNLDIKLFSGWKWRYVNFTKTI